jgi:hypothetical protein
MAKKRSTRSASSLSAVDTKALQQELNRRRSGVDALQRKHAKLSGQLAELEAEIASMGGPVGSVGSTGAVVKRGPGRPVGSTGRKRPKNETTLVEALAKVLKGKTMGVSEVAEAVQASGYKTNAENFRTIVNQTLIKNGKVFKKVERGQYTAK